MSDNFEQDDFSWLRGGDKKGSGSKNDSANDDFPEFDWMTDDADSTASNKPDSKRLGVTGELSWLKDPDDPNTVGGSQADDDVAFDWGTSKDTPGAGDSKRLGVTGQLSWLSTPDTADDTPKGGTSPLDWRMTNFEEQLNAAEQAAQGTPTSDMPRLEDLFGDVRADDAFAEYDSSFDDFDTDAEVVADDGGVPSWLRGSPHGASTAADTADIADIDEDDDDSVPSWLKGVAPSTGELDVDLLTNETVEGEDEDFASVTSDTPSWLQGAGFADDDDDDQDDDFDLLGALTAETGAGDDSLDDLLGMASADAATPGAMSDDLDLLSLFEEDDLSSTSDEIADMQLEDDFFASLASATTPTSTPVDTDFDDQPVIEEDIDAFLASLGAGGLDFNTESALVATPEPDFDDIFADSAFANFDTQTPQSDKRDTVKGGLSGLSSFRKQPDRPVDSLNERLQALREEGMSLPSVAPVEVPRALSELFPDVNATIPLVPVNVEPVSETMTTVGRVPGEIALSPKLAEKVAVLTALTSASATAAVVSTVTNPEALTEREAEALLTETLEIAARQDVKRRLRPQIQQRTQVRIGQLLVALVIVIAVLLPFFADVQVGTLPPPRFTLGSPQQAAFDLVNDLVTSDLVLVAAEYGATASGELDTTLDALLTHILSRGARPVIVSSNPIGLLRADSRIRKIAGETRTRNVDYVVGRYLAGDTIGLRSFSQSIDLLTRTDVRGEPTGLDIASLDQFSLVIVIAENADSVRTWSEQVASTTVAPFLFAVGYSAEPLAAPYADAVNGAASPALLIGYRDGYTYSQALQALLTGGNIAPFDPSQPTQTLPLITATTAPTTAPSETSTPAPTNTQADDLTAALTEDTTPAETSTSAVNTSPTAAAATTVAPTDTAAPTATVAPTNTVAPTDTLVPTATNTPQPSPTRTPIPTDTPTFTPEPQIFGRISADQAVNVREGAGRNFPIVGVVQPNARVEIIGQNGDGSWLNVRLENGTEGWVLAELVEVDDAASLGIGVSILRASWRDSDLAQATPVVPNATDLMATANAILPNATDLIATASAIAPLSPLQMATASAIATEQFVIPQIDITGTFEVAQALVETALALQTLGITPTPRPEVMVEVIPSNRVDVLPAQQATPYQDERWYSMTLGLVVIIAMIFVGNIITLIRRFSRRER